VLDEGASPIRVELGEHVVEQEHRWAADALAHQAVCGESQRQRQAALLALRGVRARRHRPQRDLEVVPVRSHRAHGAAHVVGAGRGERVGETGGTPRRGVRERHR
jgi:hypothetical protein